MFQSSGEGQGLQLFGSMLRVTWTKSHGIVRGDDDGVQLDLPALKLVYAPSMVVLVLCEKFRVRLSCCGRDIWRCRN